MDSIGKDLVDLKDWDSRKYNNLINNFYITKAAVRYFSIKKGISFTSSKVADNFPMPVTVAGSCLNCLEQLDVVDVRTKSSSPDRYLAKTTDMERLEKIEELLVENKEIPSYK